MKTVKAAEEKAEPDAKKAPEPVNKPEPKPEPKPAPKSRAEAMFGQKEAWNMPAKNTAPAPKPPAEDPVPTCTGFIYARCESCGKEKGYCARIPTEVEA